MLEQILILLNQLLRPQPAIFVEQVNLQYLLLVFSVGSTEECSNHKGEIVSESSVSYVCCEDVVVVWVEELMLFMKLPIMIQYRTHIGSICFYRWLGMASCRPIMLYDYWKVTIGWIEGKYLCGDLWYDAFGHLKQIHHFSNTLQSLDSGLSGEREVLVPDSQKLSKSKVIVHRSWLTRRSTDWLIITNLIWRY